MRSSALTFGKLAASGLLAAAVLAGCSDTSSVAGPTGPSPFGASSRLINPAIPGVIVAGADAGAFTNTINPTEATRAAGAFWDNKSSDDNFPANAASHCNVGFFAVGTISSDCNEQSAGSLANAGGYTGGAYWGDNGGLGAGQDGSSFLFSGANSYVVTLQGSYAGNPSEVGWFTKTGGVYTFHAVADWGAGNVGAAGATVNIPIQAAGTDWGIYVKNTALDATSNCAAQTACTDATGSFAAAPFQQFALFTNSTGTNFLVGIEDNQLNPLWAGPGDPTNPTNRDSDYNDYIFSVVPTAPPSGGCTYTKGWYRNNGANTITGVDGLTTTVEAAFFAATPNNTGTVSFVGSNNLLNLYQQLLAALENGGATGPAAVQAAILAAQAGTTVTGTVLTTTLTQTQISDLILTLTAFNEGTYAGFPHCS